MVTSQWYVTRFHRIDIARRDSAESRIDMKKYYKNPYVIIIAIILVIIALVLLFAPKSKLEGTKSPQTASEDQLPATLTADQLAQIKQGATAHKPTTLTFDVVGGNYYFTPNIMKVQKGDTVKINFKNNDGFHDFKIDEFNIFTPRIKSGETASISFVVDKSGTFEYYCSVGTHRLMGMKGTLIVE